MNTRLARTAHLAGSDDTIAGRVCRGWASLWEGQHQTLDDTPRLVRWLDTVGARTAVKAGRVLHTVLRPT